jgi:hypothetical protein
MDNLLNNNSTTINPDIQFFLNYCDILEERIKNTPSNYNISDVIQLISKCTNISKSLTNSIFGIEQEKVMPLCKPINNIESSNIIEQQKCICDSFFQFQDKPVLELESEFCRNQFKKILLKTDDNRKIVKCKLKSHYIQDFDFYVYINVIGGSSKKLALSIDTLYCNKIELVHNSDLALLYFDFSKVKIISSSEYGKTTRLSFSLYANRKNKPTEVLPTNTDILFSNEFFVYTHTSQVKKVYN